MIPLVDHGLDSAHTLRNSLGGQSLRQRVHAAAERDDALIDRDVYPARVDAGISPIERILDVVLDFVVSHALLHKEWPGMGPMSVPAGGVWEPRSFVDPAMSVGGGLRFNVNEHLMVRPDIRALIVFADGDTHTLGVFGVQLGYRF